MQKMKTYFKYWGKAAKSKEGEEMRYHLLAYHSLDVAAVDFKEMDGKLEQ